MNSLEFSVSAYSFESSAISLFHPLQYDTNSGVCNAYGNIKTANIQPNPFMDG